MDEKLITADQVTLTAEYLANAIKNSGLGIRACSACKLPIASSKEPKSPALCRLCNVALSELLSNLVKDKINGNTDSDKNLQQPNRNSRSATRGTDEDGSKLERRRNDSRVANKRPSAMGLRLSSQYTSGRLGASGGLTGGNPSGSVISLEGHV